MDDGSSDDTAEVCAAFPAPVRYLRQENAGVSAARNRAIREARGEWIALADSDDLWHPQKLEVQLEVLRAHAAARWVVTGCEKIDLQGRPTPPPQGFEGVFPVFREKKVSPEEHFAEHLDRGVVSCAGSDHTVFVGDAFGLLFHGNVVLPSSVLLRRNVFDTVGFFDESFRVAEETEFFHRLAAAAPVGILMSPLVQYRVAQEGSLTAGSNTPRLVENALESLERAARLRQPLSSGENAAYRSGRARLLLRLAYAHLSLLDTRSARAALADAWRNGLAWSPRAAAIGAASLLPASSLRRLHALKQELRR